MFVHDQLNMDWILITGVVIALVIITFMLLIFLPRPKQFFHIEDIDNSLKHFENEKLFKIIEQELFTGENPNFTADEGLFIVYKDGQLCIDETRFPYLYLSLRALPDVQTVFLAHIPPKINMQKRKGSSGYANNKIRCVMPIRISGAKKSGIWNDGETKLFMDREWVIYDDTHENSMFNKHRRLSTWLLVVDIQRPAKLPAGIATTVHDNLF